MTWVRLDDNFPEHPKIVDLSDRAFRLHTSALCYCGRNLTDGVVNQRAVKVLAAVLGMNRPRPYVTELVEAELWVSVGDGYLIKDFLEYNPKAEKVKADRTAAKERMRQIRSRERDAVRSGTPSRKSKELGSLGETFDFAAFLVETRQRSEQEPALTEGAA